MLQALRTSGVRPAAFVSALQQRSNPSHVHRIATSSRVGRPSSAEPFAVAATTAASLASSSSSGIRVAAHHGKRLPRDHPGAPHRRFHTGHPAAVTSSPASTTTRVAPPSKRTLASFSMEGKVCVVTGAARGLGNVMARTFVESGCSRLAILDLDEADAQRAADEIRTWFEAESHADDEAGSGGQIDVVGVGCNVAKEQSVIEAMRTVRQRFGAIHAVVNSAGIVENFPAEEYPSDRMQKLYDINVNGSYFVAREAYKHMVADDVRGSIILIASMSASIVNWPQQQAPYNASKAAVKHLASSLAVEWAKRGVRVNSISPGYMLTSLTQTMFDRDEQGKRLRQTWEAMIPVGHMGVPDDLKGAAVYLASDASRYTIGADLVVDGGYTCV